MEPHRTETGVATSPQPSFPAPRRILAATDLGPVGDAAIRVAHARASEQGGKLAICHVAPDKSDDGLDAEARVSKCERELQEMLQATLGDGAKDVEIFVLHGDPAKQIHDCAEAWNADLVVIGRPESPGGILARLFKPKVVEKVVRWAPCAVLVTRRAPGTRRIVVGTDFNDPEQHVLAAAAAEQARTGGAAYAIHCVPPAATLPIGDPAVGIVPPTAWEEIDQAMVQRIEESCRTAGLTASAHIVHESAAAGLVQAASELSADLIVVGTHGRGGLARLALGSVAQNVVDDAPCPVLVIHLTEPDHAAT
jgi:nucleotide-binding universal stress UspA family protein